MERLASGIAEFGDAARERVLSDHTYAYCAADLDNLLDDVRSQAAA